jgi:hypothetical protein
MKANDGRELLWEMYENARKQGVFLPQHMQILRYVLDNQGIRGVSMGEIRRAFNDRSMSLNPRLRQLEAAGALRRLPEKRKDDHTGRTVFAFVTTGQVPVTPVRHDAPSRVCARSSIFAMNSSRKKYVLSGPASEAFESGWEECYIWMTSWRSR